MREDELPLADGSVERVLLVHALECCTNVPRLMREIWRVLADGGRMVAIVPNRRGLWCLSDRTPFGHGQPYSSGQLERTLNGHLFTPLRRADAPCSCRRPSRGCCCAWRFPPSALAWRFARQFAGVVLIEAEKQIYVGTALPSPRDGPAPTLRADPGWPRRRPDAVEAPVSTAGAKRASRTAARSPRRQATQLHCRNAGTDREASDCCAAAQSSAGNAHRMSASSRWHAACWYAAVQHDGRCHRHRCAVCMEQTMFVYVLTFVACLGSQG